MMMERFFKIQILPKKERGAQKNPFRFKKGAAKFRYQKREQRIKFCSFPLDSSCREKDHSVPPTSNRLPFVSRSRRRRQREEEKDRTRGVQHATHSRRGFVVVVVVVVVIFVTKTRARIIKSS